MLTADACVYPMHGHKYAVDATVALRQTNLVAVLTPANDDMT